MADTLDFGNEPITTQASDDKSPSNNPVANTDDVVDVNGGEPDTDTTDKTEPDTNKKPNDSKDDKQHDDKSTDSSKGELEVGTEIEFDGNIYTIDENHNIVDKDGNVFKKAEEVAEWLKENDVNDSDTDDDFSINKIQELVGVEVTDEEGNPVEFNNTAEGVASYIKSVIDTKSNEIQEATINKFYQDNPLVKNFVDYVAVTGTYEGFGDIKDRSNIVLDKNNEAQLESVIRAAAKEFGNSSLSDNYIKYLRENGGLYDEASTQLQNLVNHDKQIRDEITRQAYLARQKEEQELEEYWKRVNQVITSKKIGNYQIPESFTKEVDGKKVVYNIKDFYDYVSRSSFVDENGNHITAYQKDLNAMSDDEVLNNELLDAYLHFTGGSYKDLINMAINEAEVRRLKVKAKEHRAVRSVKVKKPANNTNNIQDIALT